MARTEQISVLMTTDEKRELPKRAEQAGMSRGDFVRRAVKVYKPKAKTESPELDAMLAELDASAERAHAALRGALLALDESEARIERMEAEATEKRYPLDSRSQPPPTPPKKRDG